jgi:adenosylmethionine-8-amino-7-oxononanoate aminotransferase
MTLAKRLTGAHLPLGAAVLSAQVARALESQMSGHAGRCIVCGPWQSAPAGAALVIEEPDLARALELLDGLLHRYVG